MKHLFRILSVACFMTLIAAATETQAAELEKHTVIHDGMTREFLVYDPRAQTNQPASATPRPLLIVLHGGGGSAEKFAKMLKGDSSINALADREDIILAYPQGIGKHWNDGRGAEHIETQVENYDDVGFISALIDRMTMDGSVDTKRIYATGPSNGGFMSNRLACDLSDKIAAVGIVIATMPEKMEQPCKPQHPVSVLIMNGTEDPLVPFNGGDVRLSKGGRSRGKILSTEKTFGFWLQQAGYTKPPASLRPTALPDTDPKDKTRVYLQSYDGAAASVALYTVDGGGHTWPGGRHMPLLGSIVGTTSQDINATAVIWDFLKKHPKP